MLDLKGATNIYLVLAFIVPGLLIVWARAQFITGRLQPVKDAAVAYLALSVIYYAFAFPAVEYALAFKEPGWPKAMAWLCIVFVGPLLVGLLLGVAAQKQWLRGIAARLGINPVHATPTAWDFVFADRVGGTFVMATLSDGSTSRDQIHAYFKRFDDYKDDLARLMRDEAAALAARGIMTEDGPVLTIGILPREHYDDHSSLCATPRLRHQGWADLSLLFA